MANLRQLCFEGFCASVPDSYTKAEVDALIAGIEGVTIEIVSELPSEGDRNVIYFVPNSSVSPNYYDEYMYINDAWEKIGSTEVDLSNYYTKTETNTLLDKREPALTPISPISIQDVNDEHRISVDLSAYPTTTQMNTALDGKQDTLTPGENITIAQDGTISATDTTYGAGKFILIDSDNNIGVDAETLLDGVAKQAVVDEALAQKQDTLTAGDRITIAQDGTISAAAVTKQEILTALGYQEIEMSYVDSEGYTVTATVIGTVERTAPTP